MSLYFPISALINVVTSVILGIFVYSRNKSNIKNITYGLFCLSITIWSSFYFVWQMTNNKEVALFSCRGLMAGAIFIPIFYLHHILALLNLNKAKRTIVILSYIAGIIFLGFDLTPYYISGVSPRLSFKFWPTPSILYSVFLPLWFLIVAYGVYIILRAYNTSTGIQKTRIRYVLIATIIGWSGGATNYPLWYDIPIPPFGNVLVSVYIVITAYAIVRYQLMDIKVAGARAGIFLVVYALVLGVPFYSAYMLLGKGLWYIPMFIAIVLASAGPSIYTVLRRRAENRLRNEEFAAHKALNNLAQDMMRYTKLESLLRLIVHHVTKIMKVYSASIYLKDGSNATYPLKTTWSINNSSPEQHKFTDDDLLAKSLSLKKAPIVSEELRFNQTSMAITNIKRLQQEIHKAKAAVVIPAFKGDELFGFLMLGARRDNRLFTQEDLNLLSLLTTQAVFAIENARLVEKEKTFLLEKSRRDALADMAPGVAHQFDNRLQAIDSVAEAQTLLIQQQDLKKLSHDELISLIKQSQDALSSVAKEAIRGREISTAVKDKGKAKLTFERQELLPIIQTAVNRLKISRTKESLQETPEPEITIDADQNLPKLLLRQSQTDDVFYNLLDNARDAIILRHLYLKEQPSSKHKGKITIKAYQENDKVIVTVSDNGIGMKEKELRRLFVPWFTTKATSIKGAGMGLAAIQAVVEDHKGKIKVDSEYAKGTTFTIEFPINPKIKQQTPK